MSYRFLIPILCSLTLLGCGQGEPAADTASPAESPAPGAVTDAYAAAEALQAKNTREVLSTESLKKMLPEAINDLPRGEIQSNKVSAGGFEYAMATTEYRKANGPRISVSINDGLGGNLPGMNLVEYAGERGETKTETFQLNGKKAVRSFDSKRKSGKLAVFFPQSMVTIEADHLDSQKELEEIFAQLKLSDL